MSSIETMKLIIETYRFEQPVPESIRARLLQAKKRTLIAILTANKEYTAYSAIIIFVFFWLRKIGLGTSIVKTAAVTTTILALTTGTIVSTTAVVVKHSLKPNNTLMFSLKSVKEQFGFPRSTSANNEKSVPQTNIKSNSPENVTYSLYEFSVKVRAASSDEWINSTISINKDDIVSIEATGMVSTKENTPFVGPEGGSSLDGLCKRICKDAPYGALIMKIDAGSAPIYVGPKYNYIATENHVPYFRVNDCKKSFIDNTGTFDVIVKIKRKNNL